MKSVKNLAAILLFISFSFTNCSQDHDYLFTTNEIITRGNWGIEFFANQDKTVEYGNYVFQFSGNGTLQGSDGSNNTQGNWSVIRDINGNDLLTITMKEQNSMGELTNIWSVQQK